MATWHSRSLQNFSLVFLQIPEKRRKQVEEDVPVHKLRLSGAVILCNLEIKNSYTVKD